jgi:hypothetical protein
LLVYSLLFCKYHSGDSSTTSLPESPLLTGIGIAKEENLNFQLLSIAEAPNMTAIYHDKIEWLKVNGNNLL